MIEITQDEVMRNWNKNLSLDAPLVSVRCITYNHENYIAQALDSFIMQKTNFPFEIIHVPYCLNIFEIIIPQMKNLSISKKDTKSLSVSF